MNAYSSALERALEIATCAHRDQRRKGGDVPYILHPVHVAILLLKHGFGEEVVIAALLHDVVEDTDQPLEELEREFGREVANLVDALTERKKDGSPSGAVRPWRVRKEESLAHLAHGPQSASAIKAADAIHNCRATLRDLAQTGDTAWSRFNAPASEQLWYYNQVVDTVRARLGAHPLVDELANVVRELAGHGR